MTEQWKAVPGWEGHYEVSNQGRVRAVAKVDRAGKRRAVRYFTPTLDEKGYPRVSLTKGGAYRTFRVHQLVLLAFAGTRPAGTEARHMDGDKLNNTPSNLRWGTASENTLDNVRHGVHGQASKTKCVNGHEYTPENTRRSKRGWRSCIECERIRTRAYKARRKAAA